MMEKSSRAFEEAALSWRDTVRPEDVFTVRDLCRSSGFFNEDEVAVAMELVEERLARGPASGYFFLFVEAEGRCLGYACYGPIACTRNGWDLYWLVVDDRLRGRGLGKRLLGKVETSVSQSDGGRIYVETSSREQYLPTRAFYLASGYRECAFFDDFYAPDDAKVVLVKPAAAPVIRRPPETR